MSSSFDKKFNSLKISLQEISEATNNFGVENLIRRHRSGAIYKAQLDRSEKLIDIVARRLDPKSWRSKKEFMKEIKMLIALKHPNLSTIVGFCDEDDEMIIITKFEANGSLDQYISDPTLSWTQRLRICIGIAEALSFIHYDKSRKFSVIHSNVKSSKILLDDKWEPKLFGFELSKIQVVARRQGLVLSRLISGTGAYVDPAFLRSGGVTQKSDVYSLGVVLFEVLCGRPAFVQEGKSDDDDHRILSFTSSSPRTHISAGELGKYDIEGVTLDQPQGPKNDEPVKIGTSIEMGTTQSLIQNESLELKYQAESQEQLVTKVPQTISMIETQLPADHQAEVKMIPSSFDGPPSFSAAWGPGSWNSSSSNYTTRNKPVSFQRSIIFSEEENYMLTMKSLQHFQIPEDGLLAKLAKSHYENKALDDIIHPGLRKQIDPQSLNKYSEAAYCCLNEQRAQRPNIDRVLLALKQALAFQVEHENSVLKERSTVVVKDTSTNQLEGKDFEHLKIGYDAIKLATKNFDKKYYLGHGGYGIVYKAELEHYDSSILKDNEESELPKKRSIVAIKYILKREGPEGEKGFIAEIATLSSCKHPNIVSLLGFCHEDPHMILVYELVSNRSLADYLGNEGKMTTLTWVQRIKICIDIACGLDYVHTPMNEKGNKKRKIIHGDIKSANILLDENLNVKIADFGLSRLQPLNHTQSTIVTDTLVGTKMYWDPEYATSGHLKVESDVYSFGVVLFELMTGRLAYDPIYIKQNENGLAPIVRQNFEQGTLKDMVDPKLKEESDGYGFSLSKGPNKDSLHIFSNIGYQCLSEKQDKRPKMKVIIKELEKALMLQKTHKDGLRISLEDIQRATQNFSDRNFIGDGGFGKVYKGEILHDNEPTPIAVKRLDKRHGQGEQEFLTEVEILFEYKHENIISFVGYCNEKDESISVFEYASMGSLERHLKNPSLTWMKRLMICIDVTTGLEFLHGGGSTQAAVIHRDIKSANILLTGDWKAKISDFGLSIITAIDDEMDFEFDEACGTEGYIDPLYHKQGFLTRESDIYSLGVVLFEILCGRFAMLYDYHKNEHMSEHRPLVDLVKCHYEEEKLDELVFEDMKHMIVPESLTTYQSIAYECLHDEREKRPTASRVVAKLKEALNFQEDIEIWEAKLPRDYKELIQMSKTPAKYANTRNKDLYETFSSGILLQKGKVFFSLSSNEERNEMISATTFSYANSGLHKQRSIQKSRFQRVLRITDITNLKTQIKIKTQFLTPNVAYGAYLIFKFCDPRKVSNLPIYVNLKYKLEGETLHAYFATWEDDEWLIIELCRLLPDKKDVDFDVLLESMSRNYCGYSGIYVEGIHFQAINNATTNEDTELWEPKLPTDYKEIIRMSKTPETYSNLSFKNLYGILYNGILLRGGKVCLSVGRNGERNELISATTFSYDNYNRLHKGKSIQNSRFRKVLRITNASNLKTQIKIKTQFLSPNVVYGAYLIFKFCDPRKVSNQPMYVNLKYTLGSETLHAYFATWEYDEWLTIELCRLLPRKKDVDFEVLLESMSRYYCGYGAIYVEGVHFRAINGATTKLSEANGNKCHMLPAKTVIDGSSNVKCFKWKSLAESSTSRGNFKEVAEFVSHQVFEIKCEIKTKMLSIDTNYACYLIFKLSEKCHGLHCPVKVQDLLLRKKKEFKVLYFKSPRLVHLQGIGSVPQHRGDGLMEVIVWEFNSGNNDHVPMSLKLRCYEGNLSGLILYGIEFRPI